MNQRMFRSPNGRLALILGALLGFAAATAGDDPKRASQWPDSFKYYGPNGLWKKWNDSQRIGRDTWIFWTWGNQKFLRKVAVLAGNLPAPISLDFFRVLDSRHRGTRFRDLGLINEPNCSANNQPDEFGFDLDRCNRRFRQARRPRRGCRGLSG